MDFSFSWPNSSLCYLYSVLILLSSLWFAASGASSCLPHQRSALLQLKLGLKQLFSDSNIVLPSWQPGTDCCRNWEGVSCNESTGHVTSLDLSERQLIGNLSAAIFNLTSLQYLNLADNLLWLSQIPAPFEKLNMLTHLNLSNSIIMDQIPIGIANLTNLISLDLSNYGVTLLKPNLRTLVSNLSNLRELRLDNMDIPENGTEWCGALSESLPLLQVLSMESCYLSGPIEFSLSRLNSLAVIHLSGNEFNSPFPEYFADFPLKDLQLSSCNITGSFPREIFQIPTLTNLDISSNENLLVNIPDLPLESSLEKLNLGCVIISDQIPDSIGNLRNSSQLSLPYCHVSGKIPSSITKLAKLETLHMSSNSLSGSIPQNLFTLPNLKELYLDNNTLFGEFRMEELPSSWSSPLIELDLSLNQLTGPIPQAIYKFSNLEFLDLSSNQFNGYIPNSIFELFSLRCLLLHSNKFNGTVDLSLLQHLTNLTNFYLSDNQLSVVEDVSNEQSEFSFPQIKYFGLASCKLGQIPRLLKYQNNLIVLDLSSNKLDGIIPSWLWKTFNHQSKEFYSSSLNFSSNMFTSVEHSPCGPYCTNAHTIDLSYNKIEGALPLITGSFLDYSNNEFSEIPSNYAPYLEGTKVLILSRNKLTGEIPSSICEALPYFLDLSNNNFNGLIPSCIFRAPYLGFMNLASNKFHGMLPRNISKSCGLKFLDLSNNNLNGDLPRSLTRCEFMVVLNVGNNRITGTFPFWLWKLSNLQVIILRSNKLYGTLELPSRFASNNSLFQNMRIIDLASNNLNGSLSLSLFKNLRSMANISFNELTTKTFIETINYIFSDNSEIGTTNNYYSNYGIGITNKGITMILKETIASLMVEIDLSNNKFTGDIPVIIGELSALKALNLSHNTLAGSIPAAFKGLTQLESLDLSSNNLSGEIPQELTSLDSLSVLNVSFNHLIGRIPSFHKPFESSSFVGNPGLCGMLLFKQCNVTSTETNSTKPTTSTERKIAIVVLCLFIGLGFGTGFAIVIICPVIKRVIKERGAC